ncbi:4-phosphopantetheinyl transferase [Bifidobacterium margollesii]|uniref:Holo-[acyl-carrier-protein] synthase n=1 Tax=Bifidobacterium margollesii TaxID=2020964 RepID=A0A2N5JCN7_9BIFI|nr:holo-ACP synthase [Bifidobacterium margollesii]PLS31961.1 4-phosphopantetheinyl transferase [Bifidobacterium margollesii]
MSILGLGHDVVDVAAFSEQLAEPGSRMRRLFSPRELRQASMRAQIKHDGEAVHLAARWAGKEAVLKAWCEALGDVPNPYTLDDFPWQGIEILDDSRGRPHVALRSDVNDRLAESLGSRSSGAPSSGSRLSGEPIWHISLSHDGPVASAVVLLEC